MLNTNTFSQKNEIWFDYIEHKERTWINSINLFSLIGIFSTNGIKYETLFLPKGIQHQEFNIFGSPKIYTQKSHIGEKESRTNTRGGKVYYINQPMYKPTGTIITNDNMKLDCIYGELHNDTGNAALIFDKIYDYYLHGEHLTQIEYFSIMEYDRKSHFPKYKNYDPSKYIEFIVKTLGKKD